MISERWHVDPDRTRDICVLDENGLVVCSLPHGDDEAGEKAQLENAELLAASPEFRDQVVKQCEIIAHLVSALRLFETSHNTDRTCFCCACESARAALKKAGMR